MACRSSLTSTMCTLPLIGSSHAACLAAPWPLDKTKRMPWWQMTSNSHNWMVSASLRLFTSTRSRTTTTKSSASSSSRTGWTGRQSRSRLRASPLQSLKVLRHQARSHPLQPIWLSITRVIWPSKTSHNIQVVSLSTLSTAGIISNNSPWISTMAVDTHVWGCSSTLHALACTRLETNSRIHTTVGLVEVPIFTLPSRDRCSRLRTEARDMSSPIQHRAALDYNNSMATGRLRTASHSILWAQLLREITLTTWRVLLLNKTSSFRRCSWESRPITSSSQRWTVMLTKTSRLRRVKVIRSPKWQSSSNKSSIKLSSLLEWTTMHHMAATMTSSNTNTTITLPTLRHPGSRSNPSS